jgi:hypothetical protein
MAGPGTQSRNNPKSALGIDLSLGLEQRPGRDQKRRNIDQ